MTREEKREKRLERAFRRKQKRIAKDQEYLNIAKNNGKNSLSWGRRRFQGRVNVCEMGYSACELRGYCNGDC